MFSCIGVKFQLYKSCDKDDIPVVGGLVPEQKMQRLTSDIPYHIEYEVNSTRNALLWML